MKLTFISVVDFVVLGRDPDLSLDLAKVLSEAFQDLFLWLLKSACMNEQKPNARKEAMNTASSERSGFILSLLRSLRAGRLTQLHRGQ